MAGKKMTDGRAVITAPDAASAAALTHLGWEPVAPAEKPKPTRNKSTK